MKKTEQTTPIRELMPKNYLPKIVGMTGKTRQTISSVVTDERTNSGIWWAVEQLAKETDSKAYNARMEFLSNRTQFGAAA